jgi:hypothetical protein
MKMGLDAELIAEYLATSYRVIEGRLFSLKVGEMNLDLKEVYEDQKVNSAAFITACNPFSNMLSNEENSQRMELLKADIAAMSLKVLCGIGESASGNWSGEPSLLVLGITLDQAQCLGRKYQQNAIIWCGPDAVPRLEWLFLQETNNG